MASATSPAAVLFSSRFSAAAATAAWESLTASATGPGAVLPSPFAGLSFLETLPDITNWGEVLALLAADIKTC